ncbi:MAG: flagellar basal-body rod protein FlgF [Magnetovibrio sp.]|nr:flagellar basal-body rod protein FlgF [Magnetovibrio sp.]|tara:strand:+ start:1825 stop:2559 length:735 start_codon:yes stop_codon:yes gene_type:complete
METTSYIALSRQSSLRRELDIVANNIANMNTAGFKGERMQFVEHLVKSRGDHKILGNKLSYVRDISTIRDLNHGPLEKTGNSLDVGIAGDGYFVIQTEFGERYTRNGRFQLDEGGQLVTQNGDAVLSDGGQPFFFAPGEANISISRDGTISTVNGTVGRLSIVNFDNQHQLRPDVSGLYASETQPNPVDEPNLVQGVLEGSNVQPIVEMSRLIEVQRKYEGVRNFLDKEDERLRKMVKDLSEVA